MPGVILKSDDNFEAAYRRFKKQTDRNLIVTEARARRFHETDAQCRWEMSIQPSWGLVSQQWDTIL
jgi:small subunit ribosomal protein S21